MEGMVKWMGSMIANREESEEVAGEGKAMIFYVPYDNGPVREYTMTEAFITDM